MCKQRFLAFTISLVLSCLYTFSQVSDNELWTSATFKLRVNKQLRFEIEEQTRFNNNISRLNTAFTEGGMRYRFNKNISAKALFRYSYRPYSHNRYRFSGDVAYDWSKKGFPVDFRYRLRLQRSIQEYTRNSESYWRNKFSLGYNLSKLVDPFVSFESYFKLSHINKFTINRYIIGLDWSLSKTLSLETFYMLEDEFGEPKPKLHKVIGVGLSYGLRL